MKLRVKSDLYLVGVHLLFFSVTAALLYHRPWWLLGVEALCLLSLCIGIRLNRTLFSSLDLIKGGSDFISDGDFATRFIPVGHPDIDRMIDVYNCMIDRLREERIQFQEQNFFLRKLIEASPTGVIILDLDGYIRLVNSAAERLLGASEDGFEGKSLKRLGTSFTSQLAELEPRAPQIVSLGGRRLLKCWKMDFVDRGFAHHFILIEELTEELRKTEKAAYERLIRLISHEVNNTVASAGSLLESCRAYAPQLGDEDRPDFETALQITITRTRELSEFVSRLAEVVRIPEPALVRCDLRPILEDVLVLMSADLSRRRIDISWAEKDELRPIALDRGQIEQVFVNVLKNAAEAIETDGSIVLRLGEEEGRVFLSVVDTGQGVREEDRNHLFTPFFSTKKTGQGIGLTVVKEILVNHGFDFSLDPTSDGGSQFRILFS